MRAAWAACVALVVGVAPGAAQPGAGTTPSARQILHVTASPVSIPAGGRARLQVKLEILQGWHVNATPPALEYNIPTKLSLSGAHGITAGSVRYPAGKERKFAFEDTPLLVYDGTAELSLPLAAVADAASGKLTGEVEFQACNDEVCLPPASVPFEVAVTVTAAEPGAVTTATDSTEFAEPAPAATGIPDTGTFTTAPPAGGADPTGARAGLEKALPGGGIGWFVALFVGGLLLNLTPCVFPMIGVTVSIFGARQKQPMPKVVTTAILYVLGICLTYTALGVVAALTGGLFGSALQNPWVMVGLGGAMILLSLGMFGLWEMQPPAWLMNRLGGASATNFFGAFLSGLGVGIIAAPCVGPFVVGVLAVVAQKGDVGFGVRTMFTLSLGLGFPYLFLATFSSMLQLLPRSGDWMVWVKHVFGAIMIATGLYFASIGLAPTWAPWVPVVSLVLGGILLGFMDPSAGPRGRFRAFAQCVGLLAIVGGVVPGTLMVQASLRTMTFQPYEDAAVQASLAAGRPVMVDFSADWCLPCHEMEVSTLSDPRVVAAAKSFDRYKVDLTKWTSQEVEARRKRYAISGVPTILFLAADGSEITQARVVGFLGPEPFLDRLKAATAR